MRQNEPNWQSIKPSPRHFVAQIHFNLTCGVLRQIKTAALIPRKNDLERLANPSCFGVATMIVERFDRRTMAAMEIALEKACACWPNGGQHNLRKRVAQSIIQCAKTGSTSLDALIEAGERAIVQLPQSSRGSAKLKGADIRPNWQNAA